MLGLQRLSALSAGLSAGLGAAGCFFSCQCEEKQRETLAHGRSVWQPVFHVLPCDGPSAAASECSSMFPSDCSVAPASLPPA